MSKNAVVDIGTDKVLEEILTKLLENDIDITAREAARRHPHISAASTITRSSSRSALLEEFKGRQDEFRRWSINANKTSKASIAMMLVEKDRQIAELQQQLEVLTASHVAMIRAVGELGGFAKWRQLFSLSETAFTTLRKLDVLDALDTQ